MANTKALAYIEQQKKGYITVYSNREFPFGFFGEGFSVEEAIQNFKDTFNGMKAAYEERTGEKVENVEFEFKYDLNSFLDQYKGIITLVGLEKLTGINRAQLSQYINGTRHATPRTAARVQSSIRAFANELQEVEFA